MEYFIVANSFAAPFVSDTSTSFVEADSAEKALALYVVQYSHPFGLYSATAFRSSDAYHKGEKPLAQWLCNLEITKQRAVGGSSSYQVRSRGTTEIEVDGVVHKVEDPKGGQIVPV